MVKKKTVHLRVLTALYDNVCVSSLEKRSSKIELGEFSCYYEGREKHDLVKLLTFGDCLK